MDNSPFSLLPQEHRRLIFRDVAQRSPATGLPLLSAVCRQWHADLVDARLLERPQPSVQTFADAAAIECNETLWDFYCEQGKVDADVALVAAAHAGSIKGLRFAKERGASDFSTALIAATKAGQPVCMEKLVEMSSIKVDGVTHVHLSHAIQLGFVVAAAHGHPECMQMAAPYCMPSLRKSLEPNCVSALCEAAYNGHLDCIEKAAELGATDYENGLRHAIEAGHPDCIDRIVQLHDEHAIAGPGFDWASLLKVSAAYGRVACMRKAIEQGATNFDDALVLATQVLVRDGDAELRYEISNFADLPVIDVETQMGDMGSFREQARAEHLACVELAAQAGANNWEAALCHEDDRSTSEDCVRLMLKMEARNATVGSKMRKTLERWHQGCMTKFARKRKPYDKGYLPGVPLAGLCDADVERFLATEGWRVQQQQQNKRKKEKAGARSSKKARHSSSAINEYEWRYLKNTCNAQIRVLLVPGEAVDMMVTEPEEKGDAGEIPFVVLSDLARAARFPIEEVAATLDREIQYGGDTGNLKDFSRDFPVRSLGLSLALPAPLCNVLLDIWADEDVPSPNLASLCEALEECETTD